MPADIHAVVQDAEDVYLMVDHRTVQQQMPSRSSASRNVQDPEVRVHLPGRPSARYIGPGLECGRRCQDGRPISHGLRDTEMLGSPVDDLRKVA